MSKTTHRPRGRPPTIGREIVLDAAIRLLDAEGVEALTMRRLASALGVSAMALYRHVGSKDELLMVLVDRLAARLVYPSRPQDPKGAMLVLWSTIYDSLAEHSWVPEVLARRRMMAPSAQGEQARECGGGADPPHGLIAVRRAKHLREGTDGEAGEQGAEPRSDPSAQRVVTGQRSVLLFGHERHEDRVRQRHDHPAADRNERDRQGDHERRREAERQAEARAVHGKREREDAELPVAVRELARHQGRQQDDRGDAADDQRGGGGAISP